MEPDHFKERILTDDAIISKMDKAGFVMPAYDPGCHYKDVASRDYYFALLILRHYVKMASDNYFSSEVGAKNVDLFMLTPSISSPCGPGSDSAAIKIKFGELDTYLVDSSQFGFEPLLLNHFEKVYCYLPSMRGEDPDARHLNQFFHCEMEMRGTLDELITVIEKYVKYLCEIVLLMDSVVGRLSENPDRTRSVLKKTVQAESFPVITFDEAVKMLLDNGKKECVNFTDHGRDINSSGEIELMKILGITGPIWIKNFDRDRVPFYQKPDLADPERTVNADLLFAPITEGAFGGEIVGSGQRQDDPDQMYESLKRQDDISSEPYEWYIDLRRMPNYKTTSGFGLGIERFLAWSLAKQRIGDAIPYPRLKNIATKP
jgi:asparaginyl-tRNA synthetase